MFKLKRIITSSLKMVTFPVVVSMLIGCSTSIKERIIVTDIPISLTADQKDYLIKSLEEKSRNYNPETKMVRNYNPSTTSHYHTNMIDTYVHAFRETSSYALQLLDSNLPENTKRAIEVLQNLMKYQDTDSSSKTYGLWPYYLEEPLSKMVVPDWNWADFIGTNLIEIILSHKDKLPSDLNEKINHSIICASESIKKRDVKPSYTNIAIMGTFVTYMAANLYDLPEMGQYANMRLKRFYDYTIKLKGFEEYNSPTYTMVALDELCRLKKCVIEPDAKRMIDEIYNIGWGIIAKHWHVTSAQLAGPHSRSYGDILRSNFYSVLFSASSGAISINKATPAINAYRLPHRIPSVYIPYFTNISGETFRTDTFVIGRDGKNIIGSTLINPDYCIGSVNYSSMWQQRRPLLAYWGSSEKPLFFQVKFLHDFVEYSSANISSVQIGSNVLSGINFATDGGDYHINLDPINGTIKARDLRLRFEFGDSALIAYLKPMNKNSIKFKSGNVEMYINLLVLHSVFDKYKGHYEVSATKDKSFIDWVVFSGVETVFDFTSMNEAAFAFASSVSSKNYPSKMNIADANAKIENNQIMLTWGNLNLALPIKPGKNTELLKWK